MSIMKFNKGDFVVYGTNGICNIEDVQKITFPMETEEHTYYVLKPLESRTSTFFVPDNREELVSKMRYILKKEEIDCILSGAGKIDIKWIEEKNARNNYFRQILKDGKLEDFLAVIRCIYQRKMLLAEKGKKLASADEAVLVSSEKLIREEFAYTLGIPEGEVTEYIKSKLEENK